MTKHHSGRLKEVEIAATVHRLAGVCIVERTVVTPSRLVRESEYYRPRATETVN